MSGLWLGCGALIFQVAVSVGVAELLAVMTMGWILVI